MITEEVADESIVAHDLAFRLERSLLELKALRDEADGLRSERDELDSELLVAHRQLEVLASELERRRGAVASSSW